MSFHEDAAELAVVNEQVVRPLQTYRKAGHLFNRLGDCESDNTSVSRAPVWRPRGLSPEPRGLNPS